MTDGIHFINVHEHEGAQIEAEIEFIDFSQCHRIQKSRATGKYTGQDHQDNRHDCIKGVLDNGKHIGSP